MLGLDDIRAAHRRIEPHIRRTPVVSCPAIDALLDAAVFFKCENLQEAGAFKSRGACNVVFSLADAEAARGVVTHSSGNHAAALARAARRRGIPALIVMPENARPMKVDKVRRYGGQITFCKPTLADRERTAARIIQETGATLVHPYDDRRIITGQATAALELLEEVPDLDLVMAPVGGGGLLAGTATAAKEMRPSITVWGAEPTGADDAYRSWKSGTLVPSVNPHTIADGLLTSLGQHNFPIIRARVDDILLVNDPMILDTVHLLHNQADLVVEPSGAVPLAALRENDVALHGKRIGIILSGGNVAIDELPGTVE